MGDLFNKQYRNEKLSFFIQQYKRDRLGDQCTFYRRKLVVILVNYITLFANKPVTVLGLLNHGMNFLYYPNIAQLCCMHANLPVPLYIN